MKPHMTLEETLARIEDGATGKSHARRYSGGMRVLVTLMPDDSYHCLVKDRDGHHARVVVNASPHDARTRALDAPEMFDDIARAAISFALVETDADGNFLVTDHSDYLGPNRLITRKNPNLTKNGDSK